MWESAPLSISSNPIYRQIQHGAAAHPTSVGKSTAKSPDRDAPSRPTALADDCAARVWIGQVKRRRIVTALCMNAIAQSLLVLLSVLVSVIFFRRAFSLTDLLYLFVFVFLQQAYLVAFIRHIKAVSQSAPGFHRSHYLISNPSTLCCAALTVVSAISTMVFAGNLEASSLRCHADRVAAFALLYFVRRLISQPPFRFPILHLPLDVQIRSRTLPIVRASVRYAVVFTILWYLVPVRLIVFILDRIPLLSVLVALLPTSTSCQFSFTSGFVCILMSLKLFVSWEMSRHILEIVLMQSIVTDKATSISVSVLVKVLQQDQDQYSRSLGFLELSDICNASSEARLAVFRSSGEFSLWTAILQICIGDLNAFSKSLYVVTQPETRHRARSYIYWLFARADDLINASQALSALVVHSIEEDEMGFVQRSFEDIVGSLLAASIAIEHFAQAAFANAEISDADQDRAGIDGQCGDRPEASAIALSRALDRALYRIVFKFYPFLKNFSFPREYALRLRQYAEFQQ